MTTFTPFASLAGGVLIGVAASLLLLLTGRMAGVSGIVGGIIDDAGDRDWRVAFVVGLLAGGLALFALDPAAFRIAVVRSPGALVIAGLLVGFGTQLGSGCTSGHAVCGIGRGSPRGLVATLVFMLAGALTVYVVGHLLGGA